MLRCRRPRSMVAAPVAIERAGRNVRDRAGPHRHRHAPSSRATGRHAGPATSATGGGTRSSTRSTSAASPTRTATGPATWPASASKLPYLRDLGVDAMWFTPWYASPHGGRRLRRRRLPGDRSRLRDAGRGRGADRRGARARDPDDHRRRPEPRLGPASVVQGGPRRRPGSPERDALLVPPGSRRRTATRCRPTGPRTSRATDVDADDQPGRHARRVVPPPVLGPPARPQLESPRRPPRSTRRSSGSGSIAARPASGSTRRRCWSRTRRLPEVPADPLPGDHPTVDRDELHDIYRSWRAIADSYPGDADPRRRDLAAGHGPVRPLPAPRRAPHRLQLRLPRPAVGAAEPAGLDRRDARRPRPGRRAVDLGPVEPRRDPARSPARSRGHRRSRSRRSATGLPRTSTSAGAAARAAALLSAALPGSLYIYQGDELGLDEVEDLPLDRLQDPMYFRSGGIDPGRDGCRVPLPWSGDEPPFGFSPAGAQAEPWLPQPGHWADLTVEAQRRRRRSRCSTSIARPCASGATEPGLGDGPMTLAAVATATSSRSAAATGS